MNKHTELETRTLAQLKQEHVQLEKWFAEIMERAATGDPRDCDAIWNEFTRQLSAHLAFEERELFPSYEQRGPTEAELILDLRREHDQIRKTMERIGIELQLHVARAAVIDEFLALIHGHAVREAHSIYLG